MPPTFHHHHHHHPSATAMAAAAAHHPHVDHEDRNTEQDGIERCPDPVGTSYISRAPPGFSTQNILLCVLFERNTSAFITASLSGVKPFVACVHLVLCSCSGRPHARLLFDTFKNTVIMLDDVLTCKSPPVELIES